MFPKHASVVLKYAGFLRHVKKDATQAELHYRKCTEINPQYAEGLGSYASFLYGTRRNMNLVESLFENSIQVFVLWLQDIQVIRLMQIDPYNVSNLCNYGLYLSEEKRDYTRAEEIYQYILSSF